MLLKSTATLVLVTHSLLTACVDAQEDQSANTRIYRSPALEDRIEYPDLQVANSRFAALLAAIQVLLGNGNGLIIGPPLPITYENEGQKEAAWEVGFYDSQTNKLRYVYVIEASTGVVRLVCDRTETPSCG